MNNKFLKMAFAGLVLSVSGFANARLITNGFTFSVASNSDQSSGNHFHSSTGGDFGNPSGKAEVGNSETEEVRGLSEYDMAGQLAALSAFVTFDVFSYGLFAGVNNFPFTGTIDVLVYEGNNLEELNDYQAAVTSTIGSFSTLGLNFGDVLSFDVLPAFDNAVSNSWSSFGVRLQTEDTVDSGGAWVFDDFRLTTTDDSSNDVPEPSTLAIFALGMIGLASRRFKKQS
jgi:hypothetical protein